MASEWADFKGLAEHLGLTWPKAYRTLWRYYHIGRLPGRRIGKCIRFHLPSVDASLLAKYRRQNHLDNLPQSHT